MRCIAYQKRIDKEAWLHGQYVYMALTSVASMFGEKKENRVEYPQIPFLQQAQEESEKPIKKAKTKIEQDQVFRDIWNSMY